MRVVREDGSGHRAPPLSSVNEPEATILAVNRVGRPTANHARCSLQLTRCRSAAPT